jgi:glycerol-3-phosphate dehydrogenase (NAD+)
MSGKKRVAIIGSGNWGSAIARIVGWNVQEREGFEREVRMWVYEEMVNGRKLTEIINETHCNEKYLPDFTIPDNVVADPDLVSTARDADILIFVLPHQFIRRVCSDLKDHIKPGAFGISLIKGIDSEEGHIQLITEVIHKLLGIDMSALMGANIAMDVAKQDFCEATIGSAVEEQGQILKLVFQRPQFRINVVPDAPTVELCGALKNIVAVAAGFMDGLKYGASSKSAVIRIGLQEMWRFVSFYYQGCQYSTLLESCGVADLIATCFGGRNRRVAEAFVTTGKPIEELEVEMLGGQKLQGPLTAKEVHDVLVNDGKVDEFPLMTAVHMICTGQQKPQDLVTQLAKL